MSEEEDDCEVEVLPDLPAIIHSMQDMLDEWNYIEDLDKITKRKLAEYIGNMIDHVTDLMKYMLAKSYQIEILDKAVAHIGTKYIEQVGEENADDQTKKIASGNHLDMFT
jgi:hypothetical protein